ncbi:MAG: alpha/beta hydrolase [Alphaproteobacteria bacterium]|nr:alpha/beta hydrolase [Alphaproteobacteria bacterium]MCB9692776.1 alpha/beta hydrolase [Alphaproteobacteria bacterium]
MTTRADRLLRLLARFGVRSRLLQPLVPRRTNARGDVLDPQVATMLWLQRVVPAGLEAEDVASMREAFDRSMFLVASNPVDVSVRDAMIGETRARWYEPRGARGALVYVHGGGWALGSVDGYDVFTRRLAVEANRVVVSIDYPLAPEHPWPASIHAVADTWRALHPQLVGEGHSDIVLAGDSAGGNLTTNACRVLRDAGDPLPSRQVLIYPGLDPRREGASHRELREGLVLTEENITKYLALWAPDPDDPLGCPLHAGELEGMPPALIVVAGFDPLRDEGLLYASHLREAGVPVEVVDEASLTHGFLVYDGLVRASDRAVTRLAERLRGTR